MLTFRMMVAITVLLLIPLLLAMRYWMKRQDIMLCQMLLGYTACYFMKNFHALLNRAINGREIDGLGMNCVALLASFFFLVAVDRLFHWESAGKREGRSDAYRRRMNLLVLAGLFFLLAEGISSVLGMDAILLVSNLMSLLFTYAIVLGYTRHVPDMEE